MDNTAREPGFDEFRYVFQVTAIRAEPKGYLYLRAKNSLRFVILGATEKYPHPGHEEWVVVRGDWGNSVLIDGIDHPVPTQFSGEDKWGDMLVTRGASILVEV
ncbi:hypothetical protein Q3G72_022701 [Acer saccharum]|nr:hypothetical protein Q3G72_022701 [Acer saccharum]